MQALMDLGGPIGWIGTLLVGFLAGYAAEKLTGTEMGMLRNIITGIIGSFIGGFLANAANIRLEEFVQGWFWGNLLVSIVGAVLFLTVLKLFRSRRTA